MKEDIQAIRESQEDFQGKTTSKLDELLKALLGDTLSGSPGLTARMQSAEDALKVLEDEKTRNSVYIAIIKWLIGIIVVGIIGLLIDTIFKKPVIIYQQSSTQSSTEQIRQK